MHENGGEIPGTTSAFLPEMAADFAAGQCTAAEFAEAFGRTELFFQRPERPGFLTVADPAGGDGGVIPVFSSLVELARYAGACAWASARGADLAELAPAGFRFILDMMGPHPQFFDPARAAPRDRKEGA
ncbi:SseB family protein [Streptomyces platensis]|uniref:SseB family protein n=1 Tax=Streptomyces platensis TaxID=58346 RepID=UPI002ED517F5|nr:SseB family protein [Streptomyces platensis]